MIVNMVGKSTIGNSNSKPLEFDRFRKALHHLAQKP
jgi:hypothetical protein